MQNTDCSCFSNILKMISVLQKNSSCFSDEDGSCARPFLGNLQSSLCYNTRPVTFYTCNGDLLTITLNDGTRTSSVFRVEKVDGCCVTVSILVPREEPTEISPYVSSLEYATINLDCVCVLQCLPDVIVENIC